MSAHTTKNATSAKGTWSFYGDDDTGVDSDAANQLDLMTGGVVGLTVDSSQDVSIPAGDLAVSGNITMTGTLSQSSGNFRTPQGYYLSSIVSSIADGTAAGGVLAMSNPFGADVLLLEAIVNLGTACSSAAGTINIGVAAASNTSADNIFDGLDLTTASVFNNVDDQGTNGKLVQLWASDAFITGTVATGNISDAVASVYVTVLPV